jgi:hypothetical protein
MWDCLRPVTNQRKQPSTITIMSNENDSRTGNEKPNSRKGPLIVLSFFLIVATIIGIIKP